MGIISPKPQKPTSSSNKRRSTQLDFSGLNPLKTTGTKNFIAHRGDDASASRNKNSKKSNGSNGAAMDEDSDDDDEVAGKMEDIDDKDERDPQLLSPEDAKYAGEITEKVGRIKASTACSLLCGAVLT